jgi:hypothetical protein
MLSKLFGKKPSSPTTNNKFFPENRLEALLMQAANDLGARPEFYKELLDADLFVLILTGDRPHGKFVAQQGDVLKIKGITVEGRKLIPVFTSERRLREFIQEQYNLAELNGRVLFSMIVAQNDGIVLNPASNYGKEFTPKEVASLVDGSIFMPEKRYVNKETKVEIGAPLEYPSKVVDVLSSYFQGKPEVKKAYVAQIHVPDSGEPPHLIFAIQADGDFSTMASDLNVVFTNTLGTGQFADLLQLGKSSLDDYFKDMEPFFQK